MKRTFTEPELVLIRIAAEDVICTSGDNCGGGNALNNEDTY